MLFPRKRWAATVSLSLLVAPVLAAPASATITTIRPGAVIAGTTPLRITTAALPVAVVGRPYRAHLEATGGSRPYLWLSSGLPAGLVVSPTGVVSGRPEVAGVSSIAATVFDAGRNQAVDPVIPITVLAGRVRHLRVTTRFLPDATVGEVYNVQLTAAGGTPPYTWSAASSLPAGLEISRFGVLAGIPREAAIGSSLMFKVTDSRQTSANSAGLPFTTLAVPTGQPWTWGDNRYGQLGNGTTVSNAVPAPVTGLGPVRGISTSPVTALAQRTDGSTFAWGDNSYSELGDGYQISTTLPVNTSLPSNTVRQVSANGEGGLALRTDGTVWAWGYNGFGQLGLGTEDELKTHSTPTQVPGLPPITLVRACDYGDYALAKNGTVWDWGNAFPGNGSPFSSATPVQVPNLTSVRTIGCTEDASYAVRNDGTVWAWGFNGHGEIGDGTTNIAWVPVQVQGLTSVISVSGGQWTGYALLADGTVKAWGDNSRGQLGSGLPMPNSPVPLTVSGLTSVTGIAGGQFNGYALRSDGTVWAWGDNQDGELGNGSFTVPSDVPAQVPNLKGVVAIAAGNDSLTPAAIVGG